MSSPDTFVDNRAAPKTPSMIAPPTKRWATQLPAATDALRTDVRPDAGQLSARRATVVPVFKFIH
jgi:hypothetical protein